MSLTRIRAANTSGVIYDSFPTNRSENNIESNGGASTRVGSGNSILDNVETSSVDNGGVFASTVLDNNISNKALDGGVFAHNTNRPIAKRLTSELSTVSNDYLVSGALLPSNIRSIHFIESYRTRKDSSAMRDNKYDMVNGVWESGYPVSSLDDFGDDFAANPSRNFPGYLVFISNGVTLLSTSYQKRTS